MDEEYSESKNIYGWIVFILIGILVWAIFFREDKYEGQTAEEWFNAYDYETARSEELENRLSDYQTALEEANDNIEQVNSEIRQAKRYAWESYEEMGNALDNLDTASTVSEP